MNWNMTLFAILLQNCMGCDCTQDLEYFSHLLFSPAFPLGTWKSPLGPVGIGLSTSILSLKLFGNQFSVIKWLATRQKPRVFREHLTGTVFLSSGVVSDTPQIAPLGLPQWPSRTLRERVGQRKMALPTERRHRGTSPSEHPSASLRRRRDLASTKPSIFLLSHCGNHSNHNRLLYTNDSSPASCFPLKSQLSCAALTHSPLLWGNKHSKDS